MQEMQRMLLQLPVTLSGFAKVKVQVTGLGQLSALSLPADHDPETATPLSTCTDTQTTKLHAVAHQVQQKQPGGPLVAYPCAAGHCQVTCQKVRLNILPQLERKLCHQGVICNVECVACLDFAALISPGMVLSPELLVQHLLLQ